MKKEEFKPWCIICGKNFENEKECGEHTVLCVLKENERLRKQNAVLEAMCLRLKKQKQKNFRS